MTILQMALILLVFQRALRVPRCPVPIFARNFAG